jgi:hypothetical protein
MNFFFTKRNVVINSWITLHTSDFIYYFISRLRISEYSHGMTEENTKTPVRISCNLARFEYGAFWMRHHVVPLPILIVCKANQ